MRDSIPKLNTKPIQRCHSDPNRHVAFLASISQCQVEQLAQRLIAWNGSKVLSDIEQADVRGGLNSVF